jgi:hypothetical protein
VSLLLVTGFSMTIKLRNFYETGCKINADPLVYVFEDFLQELDTEVRAGRAGCYYFTIVTPEARFVIPQACTAVW